MAVVKVPDPRVDALSDIVHPKEKKYAEVTFLDFPPSQERKAALENQSLVQLREVDALAQVVRALRRPAGRGATRARAGISTPFRPS